jgi:hypothetical protein
MPLVVFRSRAASEVIMFSEVAQRLLEITGKTAGERGVFTPPQLDAAIAALVQAVEQEKAAGGGAAADTQDEPGTPAPVSLRLRAWPLIEMLRAAQKRQVDVTWGV